MRDNGKGRYKKLRLLYYYPFLLTLFSLIDTVRCMHQNKRNLIDFDLIQANLMTKCIHFEIKSVKLHSLAHFLQSEPLQKAEPFNYEHIEQKKCINE